MDSSTVPSTAYRPGVTKLSSAAEAIVTKLGFAWPTDAERQTRICDLVHLRSTPDGQIWMCDRVEELIAIVSPDSERRGQLVLPLWPDEAVNPSG